MRQIHHWWQWLPYIYCENCPFHWCNQHFHQQYASQDSPNTLPQTAPDPLSHFSTTHQTDRQADTEKCRKRPVPLGHLYFTEKMQSKNYLTITGVFNVWETFVWVNKINITSVHRRYCDTTSADVKMSWASAAVQSTLHRRPRNLYQQWHHH